ncbi:unnamed protein product [Durusdinium trenchii]|uniref:Uncharacterized protein n=1 Tax=Durusdinium trenchii TaxID=1381693 RepID=A0ABP0IA83_9DINO
MGGCLLRGFQWPNQKKCARLAPSVPRFDVRRDLTVSLVCLANLDSCGFLRVCVFRCCFFWCVFLTARSDLIVTDRHRTVHAVLSSPSHVLHPTLQAAQSALLSQLDKEQENLQLEVQELERQVQERMLVASMKVPIDGQAEEKAKTAVQEMDRQIQALRTVQVPPSRDHAGQNDLHARLAGVQRCQEALKRGDHPDELPPVLRPVREALLLEKENQALMRQIVDLGPETEKFRANFATFKRSMERFNFRRRLSSQKRNELGDRNRNRALRQSCRELNVLREQVKRARAEAALD